MWNATPKMNTGCAIDASRALWFMPVQHDLVHSRNDDNFRKGACHGAHWFSLTCQNLIAEGRTGAEVAAHLADLAELLDDWRSQTCDMPDGNPWDWSYKDLSSVLQRQKVPRK